jgi:hypothetical protein
MKKGSHHTKEAKKKNSISNKGQHHSLNTEFKKGNKGYWTGKKMGKQSKEQIEKRSKAQKISMNKPETKIKTIKALKTNWKNTECRKKIIQSLKNNWENPEYRKKVLGRRPMSSLERKFNEICIVNNLPYTFVGNGKFWVERCNPDFINTNGEKIAVEVYYRRHKELFRGGLEQWKQRRQETFNKYGWKILFFDETTLNDKNIINKIKEE